MRPRDGNWPPGKIHLRIQSLEMRLASYWASPMVMTWMTAPILPMILAPVAPLSPDLSGVLPSAEFQWDWVGGGQVTVTYVVQVDGGAADGASIANSASATGATRS